MDPDGDALQYQWRVTGGTVDNRSSSTAVWTMPDGPGLHFAYVSISDGKGGYVEQQYAVSSDALRTAAPVQQSIAPAAVTLTDFAGSPARLRFVSPDATLFKLPNGGSTVQRLVYLPDMPVQVMQGTQTIFSGLTDLSGEVDLPKLQDGVSYSVHCATSPGALPQICAQIEGGPDAFVAELSPLVNLTQNLRLYGHIGLSDGGTCGSQNEYFNIQSAATVQLLQADGDIVTPAQRVNRFGDYEVFASVPVKASLKLRVQCESLTQTFDVPSAPNASGFVSGQPVELSLTLSNSRPQVARMIANGPDGNVRGEMVLPDVTTAVTNTLPGPEQFLTYKGKDTRLSACMYYRAFGAVTYCAADGTMIKPISFEDWRRARKFQPYETANGEVSANYINKMDLNLVRRMVGTQAGSNEIAFYVCNHPGPGGSSQAEVDSVLATGLADEKRVACVAMEWSVTSGVNGNQPFTKFLTFAPDGGLLASINLDARGEKYMPGACVACHGGGQYNGRFPDKGNPSPFLGARFLPFDTGNFLFGSNPSLTEAAQSKAIHDLNKLVAATESSKDTAISKLIANWYPAGTDTLDKAYVPDVWRVADGVPATRGAAKFYREIVGSSCRTCHASLNQNATLGTNLDWDREVLSPARAGTHACGGTRDLVRNASMPNALISRDRIQERVQNDSALASLMDTFLGCSTPLADPAYPKR
jgi:mono/diheme cytochrome c family protein